MTWASEYCFTDPFIDLRDDEVEAERLAAELLRELLPGHVLHGRRLKVVARALPQDEVIVETTDGDVALVHLTWGGKAERPPWPRTDLLGSADDFEEFIALR